MAIKGISIHSVWDKWWSHYIFWHHDWLKMGRLLDITGDIGTYYFGVVRTVRVSEAVLGQQWNIRGHMSRHFHALHDRIQNERVHLDEYGSDVVLWKHGENTYESHFSSSKTWDQIRWRRIRWFGARLYGFHRASLDTLSLYGWQKRIAYQLECVWGLGVYSKFVARCERDETRDHIFFACPFTFTVWNRLAGRLCGRRINPHIAVCH